MTGHSREYWEARWAEERIGFHADRPNTLLSRYFETLELSEGAHCLVPLCGKSFDMVWIAEHGQLVTGVEFSGLAIQAFCKNLGNYPTAVAINEHLISYRSSPYHLIQGDFFQLQPSHIPPVDWIYDRAALIAFPPEQQQAYATHMASFLQQGKKILLIGFECEAGAVEGPPFNITEKDVNRLFGSSFSVRFLERVDVTAQSPHLVERGAKRVAEFAYVLTRN